MSMPEESLDERLDDDLAVAPTVERHILVRTPAQTATLLAKRFRWAIAVVLIVLLAAVVVLLTGGTTHHTTQRGLPVLQSVSVDHHAGTAYWTISPSCSSRVSIGGTTCWE
jgi:hypothetical protein